MLLSSIIELVGHVRIMTVTGAMVRTMTGFGPVPVDDFANGPGGRLSRPARPPREWSIQTDPRGPAQSLQDCSCKVRS